MFDKYASLRLNVLTIRDIDIPEYDPVTRSYRPRETTTPKRCDDALMSNIIALPSRHKTPQ